MALPERCARKRSGLGKERKEVFLTLISVREGDCNNFLGNVKLCAE